jgi:hypothetical protein
VAGEPGAAAVAGAGWARGLGFRASVRWGWRAVAGDSPGRRRGYRLVPIDATASAALARAVEKRVHQKSETAASALESGVEADAEATKRREASATAGMGVCCCRLAWMEHLRSARARMEGGVGRGMEGAGKAVGGGVGRRMEGAGKAVGGDCGRMTLMAASTTLHVSRTGILGRTVDQKLLWTSTVAC